MTSTATSSSRILVVEDDRTIADVIGRYLEHEGFEVEICGDGPSGVDAALASPPALIVLDLMLPGFDGFEVCRRVRAMAPVPVIMLTARGDENDRIVGLDLGADDYLAKPFSPRELTSRIKAVLRRAQGPLAAGGAPPETTPVLTATGIEVDLRAREVLVAGEPVSLTSREFELLTYFMGHPREAFRREDLLEAVWGYTVGDTSTVTVHVRRLREKIERDAASPERITTVWGVGYRFEP